MIIIFTGQGGICGGEEEKRTRVNANHLGASENEKPVIMVIKLNKIK